ncbi:iron-dependent peroxidase [Paenibacillus sp. 481]|uniref:iron-dependent peroxidase n=1 Tax=Paenibacillus sp. 481 TaxID=2835869 RepID=UPI001E58E34F|nr:iron-dependent peroxidase [Paenibacillus sp. 481]UHA72255.1 iron-dependent peroxidase [Paenibacillus sp. 481]
MGLNYIWDLVIKAEQANLSKKKLQFKAAKVYSPYMELSTEVLNSTVVEPTVEINPYYRFYAIFRDYYDVNFTDDLEMRDAFFDLIIHFLADIDLMQGMNKREYYIRFVLRDIEAGIFGTSVKEKLRLFEQEEKEAIALNILRLYETGEAVYLLKDTLRKIFKHSTIYANCEERDELLFYIGQEETEIARAKIDLIKEIFLPLRFHTDIYWDYHFGIIDVDKTMQIDNMALY